jgi:rare lipoprotein A
MPMRRTIGFALTCLVTSACATSEIPESSASEDLAESVDIAPKSAETPQVTGVRQFGKAAWYDLVGKKTASGEILDTVTATAAHRALPLASYAIVTNLDNGCSVIVKINDRGPRTRGRIIDLSPRAAEALNMKRAGVADVVIEPVLDQAGPTVAAFQAHRAVVTQ